MSGLKIDKVYRRGIAAAEAAGWELDITKKSHLRLRPPAPVTWPDGRVVCQIIFPGSKSDCRSAKNFEADLRRSGIDI